MSVDAFSQQVRSLADATLNLPGSLQETQMSDLVKGGVSTAEVREGDMGPYVAGPADPVVIRVAENIKRRDWPPSAHC